MQIHNAVDAIVFMLQGNELDDGAKIVAEVKIAGGLYPREYPLPG
jgi:hypothetical protein